MAPVEEFETGGAVFMGLPVAAVCYLCTLASLILGALGGAANLFLSVMANSSTIAENGIRELIPAASGIKIVLHEDRQIPLPHCKALRQVSLRM